MPVLVSTRGLGRRPGISRRTVERRAEAMLIALGREEAHLSVMLCDDATIAELNERFRGKPVPTDVLSFGMTGDPADGGEAPIEPAPRAGMAELLGDVVISVPTAARQAHESRHLRDEITRLLAHGLLHLLGWDHATVTTRRAMEAETERLIEAASRRPRRHEGT